MGLFHLRCGAGSKHCAGGWAQAIDEAVVKGAAMDPKPVKAGVPSHHKATGSLGAGNLALPKSGP